MSLLYVTADEVGIETGGGVVTQQESDALKSLGPCEVWGREQLQMGMNPPLVDDPFWWDKQARYASGQYSKAGSLAPRLSHFYAGTFTETVKYLNEGGVLTSYTAAAHNIEESRKAHEELGLPFQYPHLINPELWKRYVGGYLAADKVICPSTLSANCMREYGCKDIVIIPHGCNLPERIAPLLKTFTVGYLGAYGPDKGISYLLQAWKKLNYPDATLLLGGRDSTSPWVRHLIETYGGGNIRLIGWVKNVSDFYNQISLYIQPSCSEGFGIEVLEAQAHARAALCSDGAGAADVANSLFAAKDVDDLCTGITHLRSKNLAGMGIQARENASKYTWEIVKQKYIEVWKGLLG